MHAPSRRYLGQRAAAALVALLLAGCHGASSDQAALNTPSTTPTTGTAGSGGPAVTFAGESPQVAGHPAATAALARASAGVPSGCVPRSERADSHLVSVVWRCGNRISAATVTVDGRVLSLGDILTGAYSSYLSSVAASQFQIEGVGDASTSDLSTWYLTPAALAVVFRAGVVSYPLSSLAAYLKAPASL